MIRAHRGRRKAHSLLETIVATGIFVMVAVAMAGIWQVYGRALSMASANLAGNHLARGVAEGLLANGYQWLMENKTGPQSPENIYTMKRQVRSRQSDVVYHIFYKVTDNKDSSISNLIPEKMARIDVVVRWRSDVGVFRFGEENEFNNQVMYNVWVYGPTIN